jgi:hypothetical protein
MKHLKNFQVFENIQVPIKAYMSIMQKYLDDLDISRCFLIKKYIGDSILKVLRFVFTLIKF